MLIEVLGVGEEGEAAVEQGMGLLVELWVCGIFLCLLSSPHSNPSRRATRTCRMIS